MLGKMMYQPLLLNAAALTGCSLILPGRNLDGARTYKACNFAGFLSSIITTTIAIAQTGVIQLSVIFDSNELK